MVHEFAVIRKSSHTLMLEFQSCWNFLSLFPVNGSLPESSTPRRKLVKREPADGSECQTGACCPRTPLRHARWSFHYYHPSHDVLLLLEVLSYKSNDIRACRGIEEQRWCTHVTIHWILCRVSMRGQWYWCTCHHQNFWSKRTPWRGW